MVSKRELAIFVSIGILLLAVLFISAKSIFSGPLLSWPPTPPPATNETNDTEEYCCPPDPEDEKDKYCLKTYTWERFPLTNDYPAIVGSVRQTKDCGYIVSGAAGGAAGDNVNRNFLLKLDRRGEKQWLKEYNDFPPEDSGGNSVVVEDTNGFLAISYVDDSSNLLIRRTNKSGEVLTEMIHPAQYQMSHSEKIFVPSSLIKTNDRGFMVAVSSYNASLEHQKYASLIKLNSSLSVEWEKNYPLVTYPLCYWTEPYILVSETSGGYIIGAIKPVIVDNGNESRCLGIPSLTKVNSQGNSLWTKTYEQEFISSLGNVVLTAVQTRPGMQGGYVFTGVSKTNNWQPPVTASFMGITDSSGNLIRMNWFKGGVNGTIFALGQQTADGKFVLFGSGINNTNYINHSEFRIYPYLLKSDLNGNILFQQHYAPAKVDGEFVVGQQTKDGGYVLLTTGGENASYGPRIIKTDSQGNYIKNVAVE